MGGGRTNWNTFSSDEPTVSRPLYQSRPRPILITVSGIFLLSIFNILQRNQLNIQYLAHYFCRGTHLLRVSVYIILTCILNVLCSVIQWRIFIVKLWTRPPSPIQFSGKFRVIIGWGPTSLRLTPIPLYEILDLPLKLISTYLHFLYFHIKSVYQMINRLRFSTTITTMSSSSTNSNPSNHDHSAITTNNQKSDHVSHATTFLM